MTKTDSNQFYSPVYNWALTILLNLKYSLSSAKFYAHVYYDKTGYGIKYLVNISIIASLLLCSALLLEINQLSNILNSENSNNSNSSIIYNLPAKVINDIFNNFPELQFNGERITTKNDEVIFLGANNVMIDLRNDTNNMVKYNKTFPIAIDKDKVKLSILDREGNLIKNFTFMHKSLFGYTETIITSDKIKYLITELLAQIPNFVIFITFPVLSVLILLNACLQNLMSIFFLTLSIYLIRGKMEITKSIRVTNFAAAPIILLQILVILISSQLYFLVSIAQIITNILIVIGVFQLNKTNIVKF